MMVEFSFGSDILRLSHWEVYTRLRTQETYTIQCTIFPETSTLIPIPRIYFSNRTYRDIRLDQRARKFSSFERVQPPSHCVVVFNLSRLRTLPRLYPGCPFLKSPEILQYLSYSSLHPSEILLSGPKLTVGRIFVLEVVEFIGTFI